MKKTLAIVFSLLLVTSAGSAALIPSNITVDLNVNLDGIFGFDQSSETQSQSQEENNTYGERVNGQSVHTETRENDPGVQRNNEELNIRDDSTEAKDPLLELFRGIFG